MSKHIKPSKEAKRDAIMRDEEAWQRAKTRVELAGARAAESSWFAPTVGMGVLLAAMFVPGSVEFPTR